MGEEGGSRPRVRSRLDSRPGLAWPPRPPPAPMCPAERPGVSHTPHPCLGSSAGVGAVGRRLSTRGGRGLGGWGWGALSHPALRRHPHRDLTPCRQERGRWVPGSADTCGHSHKLESGFSRPLALPAWRNRGGQQPASKKGALEKMIWCLQGSSVCRTLGQVIL